MLRKCLSLLLALVMAVPLSMMAAAAEAEHTSGQEIRNHLGIIIPVAKGEPVEQEPEEPTVQYILNHLGIVIGVVEEEPAEQENPEPEKSEPEVVEEEAQPIAPGDFYVNGQPVYNAPLHTVNGVVYAPIRAFFEAALPGCQIGWEDGEAKVTGTTASGAKLDFSAAPGNLYIKANGRCLYVENGVQLINGSTMLPFAVLAKVFAGTAAVDEQGRWQVKLGASLLASGEAFYHEDTLIIFSRLIHAESGNQSLKGRIAVGNVVLNRMASDLFPSTMYGVIYQKNQFSVVADGSIERKTPSDLSITAAKLCLEGVKVTDALFFNVKGLRCWAAYNRPYLETIGDHEFYL